MTDAGWQYKVPTLAGTNWTSNTITEVDSPRVGIWCEGKRGGVHDLYLVGSFVVSAEVFDRLGEVHWGWELNYMTGNGYLIRLRRQSDGYGSTHLVGNQVWDRDAESARFAQLIESHGYGSAEVARQHERMQQADAVLRSSPDIACRAPVGHGRCSVRVSATSETASSVAGRLWNAGIRELSLSGFADRYRRAAAAAR